MPPLMLHPPGKRGGGPITLTHPKFLGPKALGQSGLEDVQATHVSCQPGQALLAAATHSDQEGIALRGPERSADATPGRRKCTHGSMRPGTMAVLFLFFKILT